MKVHFGSLILSLACLSGGTSYAAEGQEGIKEAASTSEAATPTGEPKETVCKNGEMVRRVKVGVQDSTCKVSYVKETEEPGAAEKVLWNAQQEPGFCQSKAQGFVDKLKGMGWSCE